jgi:hypothetical protein
VHQDAPERADVGGDVSGSGRIPGPPIHGRYLTRIVAARFVSTGGTRKVQARSPDASAEARPYFSSQGQTARQHP